jgi:phage/plasmid-like protein (TIGR03299 family)
MAANVGQMFYCGDVPWHGEGLRLGQPATVEEAIRAGGLAWRVETADLMTAEDPPTHVEKRMALVRSDILPGEPGRVLGVAHRGFEPVQNADAALLFDAIFGRGNRVYHTGGYLGAGEVVWLMAKIDHTIDLGGGDVVEPYALMSNSHDGSRAFNIKLTTVRVVCQNTLAIALKQKLGREFSRAHQGSFREHASAAQVFFRDAVAELDSVAGEFTLLSRTACDEGTAEKIVEALLPVRQKPRNADKNPGLLAAWETHRATTLEAREKILALRTNGKGMEIDSTIGTYWGLLNAVLEYVDHHRAIKGSRLAYALLGDGMELKHKAFRDVLRHARGAA